MASKYLSTPETTNFARLSRLVVDIICDLLRAVLKAKVPPPGLTAILQSQQFQLFSKLESRQRQILYPVGRVFAGSLEDLDFTLLYRLVRNIQGINIPEHNKGWGKPPDPVDRSLSANIDRLRVQRNEAYGHLPTASLSNSDFSSRWSLIRQSVLEIEKDALTGDAYITAVDELLTMNMDPEAEKYYIEELEKQHKADLEVKAILQDVKDRQATMATNISDIATRQEVMTTDVSEVSSRQTVMATNISDIATRQEVMATDVGEVSSRQAVMATNISDIATRQGTITRDIHHLKDDVAAVKDRVNVLSANKDIHPDLKPMIERAKARIKKEKEEKKFYPTKGFCDAKEKLLKNNVVVIKGNTGDGKTAIAFQLLHWLSEEQHAGQPLQLHKIEKLDLLSPNLKLITFIDDIFGENEVSKTDVGEWNKRVSDVKTCFLDEQTETNFLVITVRNEVFNSLEKQSMGTIFTKDNLIDLSSHTYKIAKEKEELLEMYKPKNFSWTDDEKTQIKTYAPNIGFPQCCQLFYNSEVLQKERARCFENPFDFLNEALTRLQECSSLLYLFLNDGEIMVKDLDPNSKTVNEKLLKEAFNINLTKGENDRSTLTSEKKLGFVKESLEKLVGFLVVKEEDWWSGEDVYRFNHNSVYVAVALLYGQATPIGFIQNCPSKSLSYLTTSKTATNMIVISSDYYTEMCERLLREFERMKYYGDTCIGSLDVWNDPVFVKRFVTLLNDRKVDKLDMLNKACRSGAEECVLYLLSEGVKPNKDTALWSLVSRHWNDSNRQVCLLRKIVVYLNDETKRAVLNEACDSGAEECALYLLSEGVKPNEVTALWSLVRRHCNDSNRQVCLLRKIVVYLNDETKLAVLNEACDSGAEECVLYLLSEGVKPNKDTALSLVGGHWNDGNRQLCLLREIVVYLNDETKLAVLNKACHSGAEECVLYLLSEGVKPNKDTALWSLVGGHWNDGNRQLCLLREIVVYLNDETKLAVLNKACHSGAEECVLYLLSEGVKPNKYTALWSLVRRHWNDSNRQVCLLRKIVVYLNDETKRAVLNEACDSGAEECALYLLSEGVKPNKDTALSLVSSRLWNDGNRQLCLLREIVVYLNDETKLAVLNEACHSGAEECVLYLLSEGVKPNKETAWLLVRTHWNDSNSLVCLLRKIVVYLNDETKLDVLNKACYWGAEECVLYLLSEGVKPNKDTDWWSLVSRHWNDSNSLVCLLRKIVVYLNDETKLAVLNKACYWGAEECVLYLLSEDVKPNKETALSLVSSIHWNDSNRQVCLLRKIVVYLNDETKLAVLNEACHSGAEECVLYLLSEDVKPNKETALLLVSSEDWYDSNRQVCLLRKIVVYLNDEIKLDVLNTACDSGAEECVLYLLSEGVKPNEETALLLVSSEDWYDSNRQVCLLRKIVVYLNDETKLDVLNKACYYGAEECALYLLSEGVKPNEYTDLWPLVSRHRNDSNRQVCLLRKMVVYLNDETKLDVLNKACRSGAEEFVLYLLSEGVKPNKDTTLWSLVRRHWNDSNRQVCLLRKIVVYLNDETKLDVLNKACRSGAEEFVLYLLSEGVKPNKDTTLWSLVRRHWNDSNRQVCLLRKIVVYLNDETKLDVLNTACDSGAEECALYLLSEGVKPNKVTVFNVVWGRSVKVLDKLLTYDITPTARHGNNDNVLHMACVGGREEIVTLLCNTYPHLVHVTNNRGQTPLYTAAQGGKCSVFQTVERCVLNSLYRVEDQQHQCESVDGRVIHRNCVCAQYMAQLLDCEGRTVLHESCVWWWGRGREEVCLYLCQSYPTLTTAVSKDGTHCLHFIAGSRYSNIDMFTECEAYVKQYQQSTGGHYDITTILDNKGESVLDKAKKRAKKWRTENNPLLDYLIKEFGKQK